MSSPAENAPHPAATLVDVAIQVLEQQAFMFGEPCAKEELETAADIFLHAHMEFSGPACGTVGIEAPAEVCAELAANMLGVDVDDSLAAEDAEDALRELLNVVCGQLLTTAYGAALVFDLSIPQMEKIDRVDWETQVDATATSTLLVDDEPFLVYLKLKEDGA